MPVACTGPLFNFRRLRIESSTQRKATNIGDLPIVWLSEKHETRFKRQCQVACNVTQVCSNSMLCIVSTTSHHTGWPTANFAVGCRRPSITPPHVCMSACWRLKRRTVFSWLGCQPCLHNTCHNTSTAAGFKLWSAGDRWGPAGTSRSPQTVLLLPASTDFYSGIWYTQHSVINARICNILQSRSEVDCSVNWRFWRKCCYLIMHQNDQRMSNKFISKFEQHKVTVRDYQRQKPKAPMWDESVIHIYVYFR
jgi:hypothetical protein